MTRSITERKFIEAYAWLSGTTCKEAEEIFRFEKSQGNTAYIMSVIKTYEENAKKAFVED